MPVGRGGGTMVVAVDLATRPYFNSDAEVDIKHTKKVSIT